MAAAAGLQPRRHRRSLQTARKTAALVLPMLAYIAGMPPPTSHSEVDEGPYALVLAPTRELAQQIERETVKLAACLGIRVVSIVGGKADDQSTICEASMLGGVRGHRRDGQFSSTARESTPYSIGATTWCSTRPTG
ncbi:hypothetical protein ZWY2020_028010 [Hordeum vulgare]|nr:hypothetical protein ZWY2020_028010 [Hordeum vulgare]